MADKAATLQTEQIKSLEKKMKSIDSLTENKVYADPLQKLQEEMLNDMLKLRANLAKSIEQAIQSGGSGAVGGETVTKDKFDAVQKENSKLKYRIKHLLRALGEDEGSSGGDYKLYVIEESDQVTQVKVAAALVGVSLNIVTLDEDQRVSKEQKAMNPSGKYPLLETKEGSLSGVVPIVKYLCKKGKKLMGDNSAVTQAKIDQWCFWTVSSLQPTCQQVSKGIFGQEQVYQGSWNESSKALKDLVKQVNTALTKGNGYLVGGQMSIADVLVATAMLVPLQTILDAGFRKAMGQVTTWAQKIFDQPESIKILGKIQMCAKPLKPVCIPDPVVKKEEKKAAAAAPKPAASKDEKPKDNVEALPPTSFNVYDFKTFYVNHADKKGVAVDEWYKMLDWEGWSFWHFTYEKFGKEGQKLHITNNMMAGFLSRAEHVNKYSFARHGVFGEEPSLEIMGVWLCRGTEIPDGLAKEHPQFEYYKTRKLDPRKNKDDDKMVREYFGSVEEEMVCGMKA